MEVPIKIEKSHVLKYFFVPLGLHSFFHLPMKSTINEVLHKHKLLYVNPVVLVFLLMCVIVVDNVVFPLLSQLNQTPFIQQGVTHTKEPLLPVT